MPPLLRPLLLLAACLAAPAYATDIAELFRDAQKSRITPEEMTVAWWITPDIFVAGATAAAPGEAELARHLQSMSGVIIFLVTHNRLDAEGRHVPVNDGEDGRNARLEIESGPVLVPLRNSEIDEHLYAFMENARPTLANAAGSIGEGFYFTVFRQPPVPLKRVDPREPGRMTLHFAGATFTWRLPLPSLMPGRIDRRTGETFPGNYRFNPYTGDHLAPAP